MEPPPSGQDEPLALSPGLHINGYAVESEIVIEDRRWLAAVPRLTLQIRRAITLSAWMTSRPYHPTILLTNDRAVKTLNAIYRGRNKPTNVLTFEASGISSDGDIALAFETVRREATSGGKRLSAHMLHLLVHGILHLAGHDHLFAGEARRMEQAETRILSRLGISNPWRVNERVWR